MADDDEESPPLEEKEEGSNIMIATEDPAEAALQVLKKKRLCRRPVRFILLCWFGFLLFVGIVG